jgi:ornithine cyclodeaminase/alanine dehydrogenase-like protein (mu-crystallin family)
VGPTLGHLVPGVEVAIHDRDASRAAALAEEADHIAGIAAARAAVDARAAVRDADVVVTCVAFGPVRQVMDDAWFAHDALVVAVDYATSVAADVARGAGLFLVDEEGQFRANRDAGLFDGYPDPSGVLGTAIRDAWPRPTAGRVVVTHLGVGLADLVFADAILAAAEARGIGTLLRR